MTTTLPTGGPSTTGGPQVRVDARPGHVYAYDVRIAGVVVEHAYIGRARDVARRDRQHRGLAPQRTGEIKEQPWADQIVRLRVLASGVWTDADLDAEEVKLIHALGPVLNDRDNRHNPNRIPIYTQHVQRKERDPNWVIPDWGRRGPVSPRPETSCPVPGPSRGGLWTRLWATRAGRRVSVWLHRAATIAAWWAFLTTALTVGLAVWGRLPLKDATGAAAVVVAVLLGGALYLFRPQRGGRTNNQTNRRRRT